MSDFADETDRLSSLRAERHFAGLCVSCGDEAPYVPLNPHLPDEPTHCRICANLELKAREKAERRSETWPRLFTVMLVA